MHMAVVATMRSGKKGGKKSKKSEMQDEAEAARKRIADLKARKARGELTPEELAELERLEGRLAALEEAMSLDPDAAAKERKAAEKRMKELKKRQKAGTLIQQREAKPASRHLPPSPANSRDLLPSPAISCGLHATISQLLPPSHALSQLLPPSMPQSPILSRPPTPSFNFSRPLRSISRHLPGKLTPEEEAELKRLEGRIAVLGEVEKGGKSKGGRGSPSLANRGNVKTAEIGCQAGPSLLGKSGGSSGGADGADGAAFGEFRVSGKLPDRAMTSLGEIKFTRKDVKAMNVLMCRRLIAALYQVHAISTDLPFHGLPWAFHGLPRP